MLFFMTVFGENHLPFLDNFRNCGKKSAHCFSFPRKTDFFSAGIYLAMRGLRKSMTAIQGGLGIGSTCPPVSNEHRVHWTRGQGRCCEAGGPPSAFQEVGGRTKPPARPTGSSPPAQRSSASTSLSRQELGRAGTVGGTPAVVVRLLDPPPPLPRAFGMDPCGEVGMA